MKPAVWGGAALALVAATAAMGLNLLAASAAPRRAQVPGYGR